MGVVASSCEVSKDGYLQEGEVCLQDVAGVVADKVYCLHAGVRRSIMARSCACADWRSTRAADLLPLLIFPRADTIREMARLMAAGYTSIRRECHPSTWWGLKQGLATVPVRQRSAADTVAWAAGADGGGSSERRSHCL